MKNKPAPTPNTTPAATSAPATSAEAAPTPKPDRVSPVFIRWTKDGPNPYWRGRWWEDGKSHEKVLSKWEGTPPPRGSKRGTKGDDVFEASRRKAEDELAAFRGGEKSREERATLTRRVLAHRYGVRVPRVAVGDLFARWLELDGGDTSESQRERIGAVVARFVAYMEKHFPKVKDAGALKADHFKGFLDAEEARGVTPRTWNFTMGTLRRVVKRVAGYGLGFVEYLAPLKKKPEDKDTIHRRPFSNEELESIYAAAIATDPDLYGVIVASVCTALRRGDVACLRWSDVNLQTRFVTVKTSKTGETVAIPIFPRFLPVLEDAAAKRKKGVPYVFPAVARDYLRHADKLDRRLRKVLLAAGYARTEAKAEGGIYDAPADAEVAEVLLEEGMQRHGWTKPRRDKARKILALHFEGRNGKEIAGEIGASESTVSLFLHDMEEAGRMALVSPPRRDEPARAMLAEPAEGKRRMKRGSVSGWHAFRTTFCSIALAHGMPMETLVKITGHQSASIVFKNYDQRGQKDLAEAVNRVDMPSAFVGGAAPAALPAPADAEEALEGECVEVVEEAEAPAKPSPSAAMADLLANVDEADLAAVRELLAKRARAEA